MMKRQTLFFITVLLVLGIKIAAADGAVSERDIIYRRIGGAQQGFNTLDIHRPREGRDFPVAVFIHGGTWIQGDKRGGDNKISLLTEKGYLLVSINYRLAPDFPYPAQIQDTVLALDWIRRHIASYGGDPDALFVIGHSAGGHLAAMAALNREVWREAGVDPVPLKGVIGLDSAAYYLPDLFAAEPENGMIFRMTFGDDPVFWRAASPLTYVSRGMPPIPFLIVYAGRREISRLAAYRFSAALEDAGHPVFLYHAPERDHVSVERHLGDPRDPVGAVILLFMGLL